MKTRLPLQILSLALAGFAVAACNETSQPSQVAAAPCRCTEAPVQAPVTAAATMPGPAAHRWHRRSAHGWSPAGAYSTWHERSTWSETERSSSSVEYGPAASSAGASQYEAEASEAHYGVWVDGYGRRHFTAERRERAGDAERQHANDDPARLDPWHGYDGHDGLENGY